MSCHFKHSLTLSLSLLETKLRRVASSTFLAWMVDPLRNRHIPLRLYVREHSIWSLCTTVCYFVSVWVAMLGPSGSSLEDFGKIYFLPPMLEGSSVGITAGMSINPALHEGCPVPTSIVKFRLAFAAACVASNLQCLLHAPWRCECGACMECQNSASMSSASEPRLWPTCCWSE